MAPLTRNFTHPPFSCRSEGIRWYSWCYMSPCSNLRTAWNCEIPFPPPPINPFAFIKPPVKAGTMLADGTKDWTNYKVDIKLHLNGFQVSRIEIVPSVSQMILRASTFVPPGNLNGPLRKKSYALERRDPAHRQRKCRTSFAFAFAKSFSFSRSWTPI